MSDEQLRELERVFRETGSGEAELAWLVGLARAGKRLDWEDYSRLCQLDVEAAMGILISVSQVKAGLVWLCLAAHLGDPIASSVVTAPEPDFCSTNWAFRNGPFDQPDPEQPTWCGWATSLFESESSKALQELFLILLQVSIARWETWSDDETPRLYFEKLRDAIPIGRLPECVQPQAEWESFYRRAEANAHEYRSLSGNSAPAYHSTTRQLLTVRTHGLNVSARTLEEELAMLSFELGENEVVVSLRENLVKRALLAGAY